MSQKDSSIRLQRLAARALALLFFANASKVDKRVSVTGGEDQGARYSCNLSWDPTHDVLGYLAHKKQPPLGNLQ